MIKSNVRSHSTFRTIFAAITLLFAAGAVVQPAAATVIPETTQQMPSLAAFNAELYLAWPGTDSNHSLNVATSSDGATFGSPVVFGSYSALSDTGLAITAFNGLLYMVWVGSGNDLNIAYSSDGLHFGNQTIVSNFTSTCTPAMTATATTLYLAWCSDSIVLVSASTDGSTWSTPVNPDADTTGYSPALAVYGSELVVAFTSPGVVLGGATIVYSAPATNSLPTVGNWTANPNAGVGGDGYGGPGLAALNGSLYMGLFNPAGYVITEQTDSSGLIADLGDERVPGTVNSATNPSLAALNGHLYFAWKGTDNPAHLNIVEIF
jgi:hypothetical protein